MDYIGYRELELNDEELARFYNNSFMLPQDLCENQYVIISSNFERGIDYYKYKNNKLVKIKYPLITNNYSGQLKPKNPQQYCAFDMLMDKQVPIKLITGKFGSGKSLACISQALSALEKGQFEKIIFIRNNIQVKDTDPLGALPGQSYDKMLPYVMPICDHCGGIDGVSQLIQRGQLQVIPLGFLRGRSIKHSILYSMQSENLTKQHIQLIMGRIDQGSQLFMDGDLKQRDKQVFDRSRGLQIMIDRLKGNKNFGYIKLAKSQRSQVAAMADLLD